MGKLTSVFCSLLLTGALGSSQSRTQVQKWLINYDRPQGRHDRPPSFQGWLSRGDPRKVHPNHIKHTRARWEGWIADQDTNTIFVDLQSYKDGKWQLEIRWTGHSDFRLNLLYSESELPSSGS